MASETDAAPHRTARRVHSTVWQTCKACHTVRTARVVAAITLHVARSLHRVARWVLRGVLRRVVKARALAIGVARRDVVRAVGGRAFIILEAIEPPAERL